MIKLSGRKTWGRHDLIDFHATRQPLNKTKVLAKILSTIITSAVVATICRPCLIVRHRSMLSSLLPILLWYWCSLPHHYISGIKLEYISWCMCNFICPWLLLQTNTITTTSHIFGYYDVVVDILRCLVCPSTAHIGSLYLPPSCSSLHLRRSHFY